ncbi:cupin domain-containing protein [Gordonia sp. LSe1-13]|uniref:Cupin domain-containing protein n=1 Tax=Gordonia sesuvii TaxID=3116777 RepID=A0ABU7MGW3_9ACTN|nr:cupin domain-containing protein [Gordonia sp. LSe1-13]
MDGKTLTFRDGHSVQILGTLIDDDGTQHLHLRHEIPRPGRLAGPHWHPELAETFTVTSGRLRFRVDRRTVVVGPGETVTVHPRQVHEFWCVDPDSAIDHVITPPGRHREMFETWHHLDAAGRTNRHGVPRNPLDLALLWDLQDGYLAGVPVPLQRAILPRLARLARRRRVTAAS